jgi:integrase
MPKLKRFKKAASGQGSIFDREIIRANGTSYIRWEAHVSLGSDGSGKRKRKIVYGASQAEVVVKMDALKRQVATGSYSDDRHTLKEYLEEWLKHKELEVKPRTIESYRWLCETYVMPTLGGMKLKKLTTEHVRKLMQNQHAKVSAVSANKCRDVLSRALRQAVHDDLISKNPCEATKPLKVTPRQDVLWSNDETMLFLSAARVHRLYAAFYLALATGMRRGEVLGLRWQDLEGDTLYVRQNLISLAGSIAFSTPKTQSSTRRIMLDPETVATLEEHRLKQLSETKKLGESWQDEKHLGLVFTSEVGTPLHPRNFDRAWFVLQTKTRTAYEKLGQSEEEQRARAKQVAEGKVLPHIRFHDLRHMHVSLLNKAGVDARTIADRIGHTDPAFTLKRYAHVFEDQRKAAAIPLLRLLSPPKGEPT